MKENWKARGYDLDCDLDCELLPDKDVCDEIRDVIAATEEGQEKAGAREATPAHEHRHRAGDARAAIDLENGAGKLMSESLANGKRLVSVCGKGGTGKTVHRA